MLAKKFGQHWNWFRMFFTIRKSKSYNFECLFIANEWTFTHVGQTKKLSKQTEQLCWSDLLDNMLSGFRRLLYFSLKKKEIIANDRKKNAKTKTKDLACEMFFKYHQSFTNSQYFLIIFFRISVRASCPMDLRMFPMDSQQCSLNIESCKYIYWRYINLESGQRII